MQIRNPKLLGVWVLAVLKILDSILSLMGGLVVLSHALLRDIPYVSASEIQIFEVSAILFLLLGFMGIFIAHQLFKGVGWVKVAALALASIVIGVVGMLTSPLSYLVGITINAVLVYYLTRPRVKAYFTKPR